MERSCSGKKTDCTPLFSKVMWSAIQVLIPSLNLPIVHGQVCVIRSKGHGNVGIFLPLPVAPAETVQAFVHSAISSSRAARGNHWWRRPIDLPRNHPLTHQTPNQPEDLKRGAPDQFRLTTPRRSTAKLLDALRPACSTRHEACCCVAYPPVILNCRDELSSSRVVSARSAFANSLRGEKSSWESDSTMGLVRRFPAGDLTGDRPAKTSANNWSRLRRTTTSGELGVGVAGIAAHSAPRALGATLSTYRRADGTGLPTQRVQGLRPDDGRRLEPPKPLEGGEVEQRWATVGVDHVTEWGGWLSNYTCHALLVRELISMSTHVPNLIILR
jgi:hypothetical protein